MMRLSTKSQAKSRHTSNLVAIDIVIVIDIDVDIAQRGTECGSRTKCDLLAKPNNKLQKQLIGFNVHLVCRLVIIDSSLGWPASSIWLT